jgi:hypothetical protein
LIPEFFEKGRLALSIKQLIDLPEPFSGELPVSRAIAGMSQAPRAGACGHHHCGMKKAPSMRRFFDTGSANRLNGVGDPLQGLLRLDVRSLLALRARGDLEAHTLVLGQRLEAGGVDCREVCEQIVATIIGFDEAEAFCIVEPFHGTSRHVSLSQEVLY